MGFCVVVPLPARAAGPAFRFARTSLAREKGTEGM